MGKTICIVCEKGGIGKSISSGAIGQILHEQGKKVLLVDGDPQANLTFSFGVNFSDCEFTLNELMSSEIEGSYEKGDTEATIVKTEYGPDLLPASIYMSDLELKMIAATNREYIMRTILEEVKDKYDYIIIDCPPTLGLSVVNYLTAADEAIVPVATDTLAIIGMGQLIQTINMIKKKTNPNLNVCGILLTFYQRTNDANEAVASINESFGKYFTVFKNIIPQSTEVKKAVTARVPIIVYNRKCSVTDAYNKFVIEELLPKFEEI